MKVILAGHLMRIVAWKIDPHEPLLDWAQEALTAAGWKDVQSHQWQTERLGMGTSGSMLVDNYNIPTIGFGPGDEHLAHAPDESIEVDKLVEATYGTAAIVHSFVGGRLNRLLADHYTFNGRKARAGRYSDVR